MTGTARTGDRRDPAMTDTAKLPLMLEQLWLPTIGRLWRSLPGRPIGKAGRPEYVRIV